jgi:hypothetical protein
VLMGEKEVRKIQFQRGRPARGGEVF